MLPRSVGWPSPTASSSLLGRVPSASSRHGPHGVCHTEVRQTFLVLVTPTVRGRISCGPVCCRPDACLGVFKHRPSVVPVPRRCLPPTLPLTSARCCHAPCLFRPRGLSPPRRVPLPGRLQACCILLPTMGFTGFRPAPWRVHPVARLHTLGLVRPRRCWPSSAFPACAAEVASPPSPCPLAVVRHACRTRPRGLAPHTRPLHPRRVATPLCPMRSWASLSLESPHSRPSRVVMAWCPVFADPSDARLLGVLLSADGLRPSLRTLAGVFRPDFDSLALRGPAGSTSPSLPSRSPLGLPRPS